MKLQILLIFVIGCISAFDLILFAQIYPPAWTTNGQFDYFTIHGLWSEYSNGSWPEYCNKTATFNLTKIEKLIPQLKKYWTNFENNGSETDSSLYNFWKHEYLKHATCLMNDTLLNTEFKYFSAGLELRYQFPVYTILAKSGILPNNSQPYSVDSIMVALESYFDFQT